MRRTSISLPFRKTKNWIQCTTKYTSVWFTYFNRRLLNFNQNFVYDLDHIFFASPVCEQNYLHSLTKFTLHKIKYGWLASRTIKQNYKDMMHRCVAISFMISIKGTLKYWMQFSFDFLIMMKQLGITRYFLTSFFANLS